METITNVASTAATTVSNLIYGQPAKDNETTNNETAGKEPISGQQGKGTANEPFDQGNAENPVDTSSKSNTSTSDDFLKLNPTLGKPTTTESSSDAKTGSTGESAIPIVPLNPDVAAMGSGTTNTTSSSTATGITDKAGVTDKVWKPTELDEVKPSGAPGAGPSAPEYTPATPKTDLTSDTPNKTSEHHDADAATAPTTSDTTSGSSAPKKDAQKEPIGGEIDAILNKGTAKNVEHNVDDREADSSHSKMTEKTVRHTDASKPGEGGEAKSLAAENAGHKSESSKSTEPASPTGGDEKSGKKMSHLKDKLKDKLHIGSKDK